MNNILNLNPTKCVGCYTCLRACPVKAIQVKENNSPHIVEDRCIGCGSCIDACSYSAIELVSNIEEVENLLKNEEKVLAICDGAIAGEFDDIKDYRKFVAMIRRLGFDYVCEVSFGVDLVAKKFSNLCKGMEGKSYISSHCAVSNMYIEKYLPELVSNLSPIAPPAIVMSGVVRKLYGENIKVVNLTPCLGLKKDNSRYENKIDAFLTFLELRELFKKNNIKEEAVEYSEFDPPWGWEGTLYSNPEGFARCCKMNGGEILSVSGKKDVSDLLFQFSSHANEFNTHFNIYFCKSCLLAPGCTQAERYLRQSQVLKYSDKKEKNLNKKEWEENIKKFENISDLVAFYKSDDKRIPTPDEKAIENAFQKLGKEKNGREIDCALCGYSTCRELAIAISQEIATSEMCFSLTQKSSRIFSELKKKHTICEENLNKQIIENQLLTKSLREVIHHLNPALAIVDKDMKISESNPSFIEILGEDAREIDEIIPGLKGAGAKSLLPPEIYTQLEYVMKTNQEIINKDFEYQERFINLSIFPLIENTSVCIIFRNLYTEEERPEEIIHRVNDVIKENLLQVQQIGFILGEGAARTEKLLNSIIKTYKEQIGQK